MAVDEQAETEEGAGKAGKEPEEALPRLVVSSSPHAASSRTTQQIMWEVFIALLPAALVGLWSFGFRGALVMSLTVASTFGFEALWHAIGRKPQSVGDGSAAVTGLLLALNLPPSSPWWMCVIGGGVAILLGKMVFGGLGQNVFNPALVGRVFLLIAFPAEMTTWLVPRAAGVLPATFLGHATLAWDRAGNVIAGGVEGARGAVDMVTAATPLGLLGEKGVSAIADLSFWDAFLGLAINGSMGEVSALALLAGAGYLLFRRIITWHIPVAFLGTMAVIATITSLADPTLYAPAHIHLVSGGAMIGAFFMATDYVTSPIHPGGQIVFGVGCGLLTMVIRLWGGYPEGVSFAILIMNGLTPLIDRYVHGRKFGYVPPVRDAGGKT
jgi:electron transport complex protein RnfD